MRAQIFKFRFRYELGQRPDRRTPYQSGGVVQMRRDRTDHRVVTGITHRNQNISQKSISACAFDRRA